jgi:hypothetical protein
MRGRLDPPLDPCHAAHQSAHRPLVNQNRAMRVLSTPLLVQILLSNLEARSERVPALPTAKKMAEIPSLKSVTVSLPQRMRARYATALLCLLAASPRRRGSLTFGSFTPPAHFVRAARLASRIAFAALT